MNKIEFLYNKDKYQGIDSSKALSHYGILGQKWGQRRWQNADGTFNEAGKERYFGKNNSEIKDKKVGSIFNKKNVDHYNDKYRTYKIKDMHTDDDKYDKVNYEAWTEDLNTYDEYLSKMEKDTNLPKDFIEKYYRNVKSDAIEELSKKYPNIAQDKLLSVDKFNDDEYLQEQGDSYACKYSKETIDKINELKEKRNKYPENSAKWNKIDSEIERVEHQEWIKNAEQERDFYKDLKQYIENNYNKIKEEAQEQYKRNPEWEPADDAITGDTDNGYYNTPNVGILTTTAEKEYGYKYNKDKFNTVTLDKEFKSKDDGNINLKLDTDEYRNGGISVKEMKQRMKNNEKFIKNFDNTNDYVRSEVADWLYDQYCDDMKYYDKKPLSYEKFLNKINLQPDINSTYYSKDENGYHAIYHLNIPGYDQYCSVDFVGDGRYVDIDSLD